VVLLYLEVLFFILVCLYPLIRQADKRREGIAQRTKVVSWNFGIHLSSWPAQGASKFEAKMIEVPQRQQPKVIRP
jgi:hypothetical protein